MKTIIALLTVIVSLSCFATDKLEIVVPNAPSTAVSLLSDTPDSLRAAAKQVRVNASAKSKDFDGKVNDAAEAMALQFERRADELEATAKQHATATKAGSEEQANALVRAFNATTDFLHITSPNAGTNGVAPKLIGDRFTPEQAKLWSGIVMKYDRNGDGKLSTEERARITSEDRAAIRRAGLQAQ